MGVLVRSESSVWTWAPEGREQSSEGETTGSPQTDSKNSPKVGSGRGWRQGHVVLQEEV